MKMIRLSGGAAALALCACASVPDGSARARPRRQALRSAGRPGAAVRLPRRDVRRGDQADGARRRPARRRHRAAYVPARPCHGGSASSRLHKSEKDSTIEFTAQNGNAYFVWQEIKMGVFAARSELHLMSPPEGRNAVATCSLAEPPPGLRYPLAAQDPKPAGGPDTATTAQQSNPSGTEATTAIGAQAVTVAASASSAEGFPRVLSGADIAGHFARHLTQDAQAGRQSFQLIV